MSRPPRERALAGPDAPARLLERAHQQGARALYRNAGLYDQLYRRRSADVRCYLELARRYGGPVLELGVGSGRVARALAREGFEVVGIDIEKAMLARAKLRRDALPRAARARLSLRKGDMRALRLGRRFRLIIAPFNAFAHLFTRRDLERALASCRRHLAPSGRLAFDVVMPDLRALTQDPARLYRCGTITNPGDGLRYGYAEWSQYASLEQVRTTTLVLLRDDGSPERAIPLSQRQFFPAELEALLHYNGFAIEARFGDFTFGPLAEGSESQLIVARRRAFRG